MVRRNYIARQKELESICRLEGISMAGYVGFECILRLEGISMARGGIEAYPLVRWD